MTETAFLAELIRKTGMLHKDLASKLGITKTTLSDRLNNKKRKSMSVAMFAAMLDALGYDLVAVPRGAADGLPDTWKAPTGTGE